MFFRRKNKLIIYIEGMKTEENANMVEESLLSLPNVLKVKVDLGKKQAIMFYKDKVDFNLITTTIEHLNFVVTAIKD